MRIIFRADASKEIGSGHVMRSSVLAEEAISRGHECIFVGTVFGIEWVKKRIEGLGFAQICDSGEFIPRSNSDVCVIDSYTESVTSIYGRKDQWRVLISIQDECTPKYDANIIIVPSLYKENNLNNNSKFLSGADYLLIRRSTSKSPVVYPISDPFTVIISGGGSDPFGFAEEVAQLIDKTDIEGEFHFFTNNEIISRSGKKFLTHQLGEHLDVVSRSSHAAVTTASTSSLEFIAREIPTAVACAIENQASYYHNLSKSNLACKLGGFNANKGWELSSENLTYFLSNTNYRESLSQEISGLVDLRGAKRIMDIMENY